MSSQHSPSRCFGLFRRREKWTLTWRAWLLLLMVLGGGGAYAFVHAHDFLAVDAPVDTTILVIEGWVPRYAVTNYVKRNQDRYSVIYTTGGSTLTDYRSNDISDTYASVARTRLARAGVPVEKIRVIPGLIARRDRTFSAALSLRHWCETNNVSLTSFNVVTLGPHARRSRLLHEKAFGSHVKIGVIPLTNIEYDADHWWRYSEGVKETLSEAFAYIYSRFFFSPD